MIFDIKELNGRTIGLQVISENSKKGVQWKNREELIQEKRQSSQDRHCTPRCWDTPSPYTLVVVCWYYYSVYGNWTYMVNVA